MEALPEAVEGFWPVLKAFKIRPNSWNEPSIVPIAMLDHFIQSKFVKIQYHIENLLI